MINRYRKLPSFQLSFAKALRIAGAGIFASFLTYPTIGEASLASQELIQQGVDELITAQFEEALQKFNAAVQADQADGLAVFFQGVTLNRLGFPGEALMHFQHAAVMGANHPDLAFEVGWSLLSLGRWEEAITYLERYEQIYPGRGKTLEFLGRAYLALGQHDKAEALLQDAMRRDPTLKPTALFSLVELEHQRQSPARAKEHLEELMREVPEDQLTIRLRDQMAEISPPLPAPEKNWRATVSLAEGYNNNAVNLGAGVALPQDISHQGSSFGQLTADASYKWMPTAVDTAFIGYSLLGIDYSDLPRFNMLDHLGYIDIRHTFAPALVGMLKTTNEFTQIAGIRFRNQVGARPALVYQPKSWAVLELAYTAYISEYFTDTAPVQQRGGNTHTVALTNFLSIPDTSVQVRLGYFHTWNNAAGSDWQYQSNGLLAGLTMDLLWEIEASAYYNRSFDRYANPNSLAGVEGFAFKRRDDVDTLNIQVFRPIFRALRGYVRYDLVRENSNISFYNFAQEIASVGVVQTF